ncbi:MAG: hypothetical protein ACOX3P_03735 [Saccharofermentanales bacterium]|jgi:hypothetical protein|nr:hypothetical protein [Bacillota bacterium]NLB08628.1 hypothetical protein [Clostridiales bacterium]
MNKLDVIEDELANKGIRIDWYSIQGKQGYTMIEEGKAPYLAIDPRLTKRKQTAVAYHEAGHLHCGITKRPRRDELRADCWAFKQLIQVDDLIKGIKRQPRTVHELADIMDLDTDLLYHYLVHMSGRHIYQEYKDYVISYSPIIVYNWKTGQIWPEI